MPQKKMLVGAILFSFALVGSATRVAAALVVYNTGMTSAFDATPALITEGTADTHYTLTSTDQPLPTNYPNLYVTKTDGFPIPPWATNGPNSQWIQPIYGDGDNAPPPNSPDGHYVISTTFDLTGYDPNSAFLKFNLGSDNAVAVILNGVNTGITQSGFENLNGPYTINTAAWFVPGINTLTFDVTNFALSSGNPTGLRVEFTEANAAAAAVPAVPEPAGLVVWSLLACGFAGLAVLKKRNQVRVSSN